MIVSPSPGDGDAAAESPERDRVDRDARLPCEPSSFCRRQQTPGLRAVRKQDDGARPACRGRRRRGFAARAAGELDAPRNRVPDRCAEAGRELIDAVRRSLRLVVGGVSTTGSSENATSATRTLPGDRSGKPGDRRPRRLEPGRAHVGRVHRERDVDDEHDGGSVGRRRERQARTRDPDTQSAARAHRINPATTCRFQLPDRVATAARTARLG